jgi:GDP-mannose 6-dehydrogenase
VTAACLANDGHTVTGVDINPLKVDLLGSGRSPVIEPGLAELIGAAVSRGTLRASLDTATAVLTSDVTLVCVGTPSADNGNIRLEYVENVSREIGLALANKSEYHVVVVRSTVLPGTVEGKLIPLIEQRSGKRAGVDFGVCMNPEFLREGSAIEDFYHPSLVVIGELDERSGAGVRSLFESVDAQVRRVPIAVAEMVKYASNAFHAVKVAFANEIGNLSKAHEIDGKLVMEIFKQDAKLNVSPHYLMPGFAFGGSCLPKDLRAILYRSKELDLECPLLHSTMVSNQRQIERAIKMVEATGRKKVGILGLSFKAETDDMRESPAVALVETLIGKGYSVSIFDEELQLSRLVGANRQFLEEELPHVGSLLCTSIEAVLSQVQVVVVTTGSKGFKQVPGLLRPGQVLIDLNGIAKDAADRRGGYNGICW